MKRSEQVDANATNLTLRQATEALQDWRIRAVLRHSAVKSTVVVARIERSGLVVEVSKS